MSREALSAESYNKLISLQEAAAFEYLMSLGHTGDRDQALRAGKELIVLACTEEYSTGGQWLEIVRDELVYAAFDMNAPLEALSTLPVYTKTPKQLYYLPGVSSASLRPSGNPSPEELIDGLYEGDLVTIA